MISRQCIRFFKLFKVKDGFDIRYRILRRYKRLDNYGVATVRINFFFQMELYRHDVIRRLETFRMAKFYYPELSMIKKVSFVFSLEKKDLHNFWAANDMLNDNAEHKEAGIDDLLC